MNTNPTPCSAPLRPLRAGLTITEVTVTLAVLIAVITVLFIGARAYKNGSDRAACVMNIHNVQNAVRSFSNLNGLVPGQAVARMDLRSKLVGPGLYLERDPKCPGEGAYAYLGDRIPSQGELYLSCSLAKDERHQPQRMFVW
jgi:hypothetical protein